MKDTLKIFIGNVDDRTTQEELNDLFQKFGPVVSCAVMKQYAFVHMRGADRAKKAIEELNGRELHGKRMVVELSKPRPQNTWKIFVGNVSAACDASELRSLFEAYGRVVECDVVKDYAFVHMEKESDARAAIENLNGKEIKDKRINVEMSNKVSRPVSTNGSAHNRARRPHDIRETPQNRSEAYNRRRAAEAAYASFALKSPYEQYSGDNARYAFESRMRPPSPLYFSRDRSPLRRSPTRSPYGLAQSAASLASKFRAPASGYGSLPSAYGDQTSSSLSAAYSSQSSSLSAAYGARASTLASAYSSQGGYENQSSAYGTETQPSYGSQSSTAYSTQGSTLPASYGSHLTSMAASYSSQTSSNPYQSHSASTPYASSSALASAYRPQQSSAYDASQMAGLGMQSAYSSLSTPVDAPMYERTRLSPPLTSASDSYKKTMDNYKRLASDRRYSELADYRRLSQESQDPFRRSPPKSQLDFRRMTETQSDYPYSDFMRGPSLSGYPRRL
ncbi:PREDICTED: RNA-binding protein 14-like [Nanorana parkeri]|uniref:RNA-binding protein 14-like n=1 Tax=Nanorana parkeri TaxID=125878 RepID=UPI000854900D|nr:PREDICTED: RNA-binding protein 14-like [Nanorana parkeri]